MLGVSNTTFYNRVKKYGIKLIAKNHEKGKSSFISQVDLDRLSSLEWKPTRGAEESSDKKEPSNTKEFYELKLQNTVLEKKIEWYEGNLKIYQEEYNKSHDKIEKLEEKQRSLYENIIGIKVRLSTYQILFFSLLILVSVVILLMAFDMIQFW